MPLSYTVYFLFPVGVTWLIASQYLQIAYVHMLLHEYGYGYTLVYGAINAAALAIIVSLFLYVFIELFTEKSHCFYSIA